MAWYRTCAPLMRLAPTTGHAARGMSRGLVLRGIVLGLVLLAAWQLRQLQQLQRLEQQQQQLQLQPTAAAAVAAAAVLQPLQPASGQAESLVLSVEQLPRGLPGGPKVRVRVRVRVTVTVVRVRVTLVRVTRWASDPHLRVKVTLTLNLALTRALSSSPSRRRRWASYSPTGCCTCSGCACPRSSPRWIPGCSRAATSCGCTVTNPNPNR